MDLKTYDYDFLYSDVKDVQLTRLFRDQRTRRPQKKRARFQESIVSLLRRLCKRTLDVREVNLILFLSVSE